ncbi:sigma-70 family RNA polymerase sigma factor [Aeromicrobium sp. YIM 150415]|uniref:sigma-70 family RNA polymerase sigma factor n=1 Tax=Aeromicrobium sp. YIM 150415 TaxID=2803912 RepID=UPI00196347DB|nr:sigma-70 family RNA polymerase sigma factor [Aeromicrobium sp. YIM 150415]MBM9463325.1 sigma-70 family RNA polymerase sigma factor [Aeromicrobium sp. YIM 150415]
MGGDTTGMSWDDDALAEAVRAGDAEAFRVLFERYRGFAEQVAREHAFGDEDDIVAEAFFAIYLQLRDGRGPTTDVRAYVRRVVVNKAIDRHRQAARTRGEEELAERLAPVPDHAGPWFESTTVTRAYRSLPSRWRRVLWQIEVEGRAVGEVARTEGVSAARVSAVAYRARRGLRTAYLTECLRPIDDAAPGCRVALGLLPEDVRGTSSRRQSERVRRHLRECPACREVRAELVRLDQQLDSWLMPAAGVGLGGLGLAASGGVAASFAGLVTLPLIGVVTAGVIAGGVLGAGPAALPEARAETPPAMDGQLGEPLPQVAEIRDPAPSTAAEEMDGTAASVAPPTPETPDPDPSAPSGPAELPDWTDTPPQVGDRFTGGTEDVYRARDVRRETETTRTDDREVAGGPQTARPGQVVWEREYDEITVNRHVIDLVMDEEDRWEVMCDGSLRERTMRAVVEETITVRHRTGYRIEADGSRTVVRESVEVGRDFLIGAVLGNPPVECAPEPPPAEADAA